MHLAQNFSTALIYKKEKILKLQKKDFLLFKTSCRRKMGKLVAISSYYNVKIVVPLSLQVKFSLSFCQLSSTLALAEIKIRLFLSSLICFSVQAKVDKS